MTEPTGPIDAGNGAAGERPLPTSAPAPPAAPPEVPDALLARLREDHDKLCGALADLKAGQARLAEGLEALGRQVGLVPGQVRSLAGKVEGLTAAVSEPRLRALLLDLVQLYDLIDQLQRVPAADAAEGQRHVEVLLTQLRQVLEANGLTEIAAEGAFDPAVHRAVQSAPCADPAQANCVLKVVRPGFRAGRSVLRYAEVVVGQYAPPPSEAPEGAAV